MALAPGGKIQGISLPAFLQMIQMEKSTCTLTVQGKKNTGTLYILDGEVINAEYGDFEPLEAAYEVICLPDPVILMQKECIRKERHIRVPMMHLLMEGTRRFDERGANIQKNEKDSSPVPASPLPTTKMPSGNASSEKKVPASEDNGTTDIFMETEDPDLAGLAAYEFSEEEVIQATQTDFTQAAAPADTYGLFIPPSKTTEKPVADPQKEEKKLPPPPKFSFTRKQILAFCLGLLVLLSLAGGGAFLGYKAYQHESAHTRLQEALLRLEHPEQREAVISRFLEAFPESRHASELGHIRDQLRNLILERDYKELLQEETLLSKTPENLEKALRLYERFLVRHPKGKEAETIARLMQERVTLQTAYMVSAERDYLPEEPWLEEIRQFMERFPENPEMDKLRAAILIRGDAALLTLLSSPDKTPETRSLAIQSARNFIRNFPEHPGQEKARAHLETLLREDRKDLLVTTAQRLNTPAEQILFYERARREEKDGAVQQFLQQILQNLRQKMNEDRVWEQVQADLKRPALNDTGRISILDRYLLEYPPERHRVEAEKKRLEIAQRMENQTRQAREERERQTALLLQRQQEEERIRIQQALARLENTRNDMLRRLPLAQGRFQSLGNDTVQDMRTGKIWTLMDSDAYTGKCLTHEEARNFVHQLSLGGHRDWRLPSENEMAVLFKNPPAYPLPHPERWYWSSDIFSRGYQNEVRVVTARAETVLQRQQVSPEGCGYTLAIRP